MRVECPECGVVCRIKKQRVLARHIDPVTGKACSGGGSKGASIHQLAQQALPADQRGQNSIDTAFLNVII